MGNLSELNPVNVEENTIFEIQAAMEKGELAQETWFCITCIVFHNMTKMGQRLIPCWK